jgi:flagellin
MFINTNIASLNARRHMDKSSRQLSNTFAHLSSGLRINKAADDAAGLAVATRMTAQIKALNQSVRNANDAISLIQVAEGAMEETANAMQRIRELAVQASSDALTSMDRTFLDLEVQQLKAEINRISQNTHFNGMPLLDGTFSGKDFEVGWRASQLITFSIVVKSVNGATVLGGGSFSVANLLNGNGNTGANTSVATFARAQSAIARCDFGLNRLSRMRATLGALQNRFESAADNLQNVSENMSAARSQIRDADIALETSDLTKLGILQQAGTAVLAQANQQPQLALQLLG